MMRDQLPIEPTARIASVTRGEHREISLGDATGLLEERSITA